MWTEYPNQPPPKSPRGYWICLVFVFIIAAPMIYLWVEPHLRTEQLVEITILNEAHQPVSGAVINFHEHEYVALIPWLVFASPLASIERDRSASTDLQGKAHFGIQFTAHATSIVLSGLKLQTVSQNSTQHRFSKNSSEGTYQQGMKGPELPYWYTFRGRDATCTWTSTIIVKTP